MLAIEALDKLTKRYLKPGKKIHLCRLSPDYNYLFRNPESIIDLNVIEDRMYNAMLNDRLGFLDWKTPLKSMRFVLE